MVLRRPERWILRNPVDRSCRLVEAWGCPTETCMLEARRRTGRRSTNPMGAGREIRVKRPDHFRSCLKLPINTDLTRCILSKSLNVGEKIMTRIKLVELRS